MSAPNVFRKVSLDRLSSPERLDQLMQVTDARGWLTLLGIGVVLVCGVVWGFAGTLPETVAGPGMLIKSGGVFDVAPQASGRVVDLAVDVGDVVHEGQVLARVAQPELGDRLQQAKQQLAELRRQHAQLVTYGSRDTRLQRDYLAQQRANLAQSITAAERTLGWIAERQRNEEQLVAQGLLTRTTLLNTRQQYEDVRRQLSDQRSQLTQVDQRQLSAENQAHVSERQSAARVEEQVAATAALERQLEASSRVVAPYTGRILEIMSGEGSLVAAGEPILTLDLLGSSVKRLEAVVYVPSEHGKRIKPGMSIQIAPSTVKQEEYGLMLGRVTYVSDFPATAKGMQRILKNDRLVAELSGHDAPYEVRADLIVDPTTPSQFRWSSSKGPPLRVQSGTMASGRIEVSSRRPIELLLPVLRQLGGA